MIFKNKKLSKLFIVTLLAVAMVMGIIPYGFNLRGDAFVSEVNAAPTYESQVTFVMYEKNQVAEFEVTDLISTEVLESSAVSSSKGSVASVYDITRNEQESETEILDTAEQSDDTNSYSYTIGLKLKKAGTTTVSFTIGGNTYSTTVKVVKYVNPVKTIKIKGLNKGKNIASKTKKKNYINFKGVSSKSSTINITPKAGWTVESISCTCSNTDESASRKNTVRNGEATVTVKSMSLGVLRKYYTYYIDVTLVNKGGYRESLHYCISNTEKIQSVY